jgi:hypothetical protein
MATVYKMVFHQMGMDAAHLFDNMEKVLHHLHASVSC